MTISTRRSLSDDLSNLGLGAGDGVFVHASLRAIGPLVGGPRVVIEALLDVVGKDGLVVMPGFSEDAKFPPDLDRSTMPEAEIARIEAAVPGYDPDRSPTFGMGAIAEAFRTWPGTVRSAHSAVSVCLNGRDASIFADPHPPAWGTGPASPFGRLRERPGMKMLLIGVGWNRCTALHTAETLAETRRTKVRRSKTGPGDAPWVETPDVANDMGRLFPAVGAAYEAERAVTQGLLGAAPVKLCGYADLIAFARDWIDAANKASGDRH